MEPPYPLFSSLDAAAKGAILKTMQALLDRPVKPSLTRLRSPEFCPVAARTATSMGGAGVLIFVFLPGGNPVKYTDPDGRAAGDEFDTMDDAAIDFAMTYNDDSIRYDREYGTVIRKKENGKYAYDLPVVGAIEGKVNIDDNFRGNDIVADIHTHGKYISPEGDWFSREFDIPSANMRPGRTMYLVNPTGEVHFYRPYSDGHRNSNGLRGDSGTISRLVPRDPNSAGGLSTMAPDASKMLIDDPVAGWDRYHVPSRSEIVPPTVYWRK